MLQAFGTADQFTAEYLSKLTGQATVSTRGSNLTRGTTTAGNLLFLHRQQGTAEQTGETGRRLLLADEVRRLPASSSDRVTATVTRVQLEEGERKEAVELSY